MAPTEPIIGAPLAAAELADAQALVREAGWNQVAADWETFRALGTVFAARVGERVVATAAILPYGTFAWVSMVLVESEQRRHGLGTKLLKRCIATLSEQGRVPLLDATPAGRPLYRSLGFNETWGYHRLARADASSVSEDAPKNAPKPTGITVRPIGDADWAALCATDAAAFGADRSPLLGRLRGRLPPVELVAERSGGIAGFMLGRNGRSASQIGPLIADDDDVAHALLAHALPAIDGPIYIDFADSKTRLRGWLAECGFSEQRPLTRMVLGRAQGFDKEASTYAVAGPELG
jgi:GNAT superfamily N-acetyltransferase